MDSLDIADWQLPIADLRTFGDGNWQLEIGNAIVQRRNIPRNF
jgi:hypothetical protein